MTDPLRVLIAKIIDGEAWEALTDGRDAHPDSIWNQRRGFALDKADRIVAGPMLQLVDWVYLHALEGAAWPSTTTKIQLLSKAVRPPTQADANDMIAGVEKVEKVK